jgi:hypothetical protein
MSADWQLGDFVDVRGTDMVWKAGRVTQVDSAKGLRVEYVRNGEPFGEWIDRETSRLNRYRVKSKCLPEVELPSILVSTDVLATTKLRLTNEFQFFPTSRSSAELIHFYRGELYQTCKNLLMEEPRSMEMLMVALELLVEVSVAVTAWLSKAAELCADVLQLQSQPESLYESSERAIASMWPELFQVLSMMLGAGPMPLLFLHVSSK